MLQEMLENPYYSPCWAATATTIDFMGHPHGFPIVRHFLLDRFRGEIDDQTFNAMLSTIVYMGIMAARSDSAFQFLVDGTNPNFWTKIHWTNKNHKGRYVRLLWSKLTINSLAMTGRPEVTAILDRLAKAPYDERQLDNIKQGFQTHQEVMSLGIEEYFQRYYGSGRPSDVSP